MTSPVRFAVLAMLSSAAIAQQSPPAAFVQKVSLNIASQPVPDALNELGRQTGLGIAVYSSVGRDVNAPKLEGEYTAAEALKKILGRTGLQAEYLDDKTVAVLARKVAMVGEADAAPPAKQKKLTSDTSGTPDDRRQDVQEVVVTAQKREERLQDVPVPVTAVSADVLVKNNQLRLQDYYTSVPGLSVTPGDFRGDPILTIRGITTGGSYITSTVGVVIDDVPYGSSTNESTGSQSIDLDPSDLARVEVLRGPQGTLYGVSSIGGLIKYVTVDPTTDSVKGRVQLGTSGVYNGDGTGYNVSGAINIPINDTLAVRASGFTHESPGYIDNVETGEKGINKGVVDGGHLSALWKPSDALSIKLSALLQEIKWYGSPYAWPALGDLKQTAVRGTGAGTKKSQAYSAIIKAKLGSAELTALSGYSINGINDSIDFSPIFGGVSQALFGVPGAPNFESLKTYKFSQEIRLSMPLGQKLDWLFGAFYTHENTPWSETTFAAAPDTGASMGAIYNDSIQTTYQEYAAFTDLTVHVTDKFDVQLGARESQNRQTYMEELGGLSVPLFFGQPSPLVNPQEATRDNSFTYLVTPQYRLSPDFMLYARLASGYRNGGPNTTAVLFNLPLRFGPDTTKNYEVGLKTDFLDHRLSIDTSLYYIDWKNIQLQLNTPQGATYNANASRAKSQGLELAVESRPLTGLKVGAWLSWNDAALTEPFPVNSPAYGVPGDRLPYSSRYSGNISVDQEVPLAFLPGATASLGAIVSYVGDRVSVFTSSPERQDLPAYVKTDLRAAVNYGPWAANVFADNVTDRRGVLSGGVGAFLYPQAFTYIQPRTVGISVSRSF